MFMMFGLQIAHLMSESSKPEKFRDKGKGHILSFTFGFHRSV